MDADMTEFDRLKSYFGISSRSELDENTPIKVRTYDTWKYNGEIPFNSLVKIAKKQEIDDPTAWATYIKTGQGEYAKSPAEETA